MNILMMSNTFTPIVGGVERSIQSFAEQFRQRGHRVVIVAPTFPNMPTDELDVVRVPALQKFNRTDFSVNLPIPALLSGLLKNFRPDIIHSHHPFLMGDIALRLSGQHGIPLVFTYHTMFEQYLHYLPVQNDVVKRFVVELSAGYAGLADQIIVPSASVRDVLVARGVEAPMEIVPTGIDVKNFITGDGNRFRQRFHIPEGAFVAGYLGRIESEKNINFLAKALAAFLQKNGQAHFLIAGKGGSESEVLQIFSEAGVASRVHFAGVLSGQDVVDAYHAMDVFVFASLSETQGIVLAEAMAAGVPVVAVDAPGVHEIVVDGKNGRLLTRVHHETFVQTLNDFVVLPEAQRQAMAAAARETASRFSMAVCAEKMLSIYKRVQQEFKGREITQQSLWTQAMKRIHTEWELLKNIADATQAALIGDHPRHHHNRWFQLRRKMNRWEWSAQLLKLSRSSGTEVHPGVVLIQIDGFSKTQLQRALEKNEMPFLKRLLENERYRLCSLYPGMPSSTPAVQGELFYGVKHIVPAFEYYDRKAGKVFRMYDGEAVGEVEGRLKKMGAPLLEGGSSYSNIYSGGAAETHFCAVSLGWNKVWREIHPLRAILASATHLYSVTRMIVLVVWEIVAAFFDCLAGCFAGENLGKEIKFVPTRAGICILLRELIELGVKIDIARGLPVIHLNLLGFDEQAHRRGPSSDFAHKSLRGIDATIARIYQAASRSTRRHYDVWIYSDHGQEDSVAYEDLHGEMLSDAVSRVFADLEFGTEDKQEILKRGIQHHRLKYLGKRFDRTPDENKGRQEGALPDRLIVTAIGPTGNIYLPRHLSFEEKISYAEKLMREARIPMVLYPAADGRIAVHTARGKFSLPDDAESVLGKQHPFLKDVTEDFMAICCHPDAGEFTICGWSPEARPLTFPIESGAHAGPGFEESHAFVLMPHDMVRLPETRQYLRIADLREAVLRFVNRLKDDTATFNGIHHQSRRESSPKRFIRVMTYNVHSCIGVDGRLSPERIARVIGSHNPDIVALQEVDMSRPRTGGLDQTHLIAKELEMHHHFHPSIRVEEEQYGNAILSRYPMKFVRAGILPGIFNRIGQEPRSAIWVSIEINGRPIQVINTHFGLIPTERRKQVDALLGSEWLGSPECQSPIVICGDFNATPNSYVCKQLNGVLKNALTKFGSQNHLPTWYSHYPMGRIDHVFVSDEFSVLDIGVNASKLSRLASDHLPLIVDLEYV